jgi:16S rRNA processing protein RimM
VTNRRDDAPLVVIGRVGRPHGVHGDVSVEVRTDEPERRFTNGAVLGTDRALPDRLTVARTRWHSGRLLVHFEGYDHREQVEALRGLLLQVVVDPDERPDDPDEFYDHQLVGLSVVDPRGAVLGVVTQVLHGAQDLIVVGRTAGADVMVPFVHSLVPEVDLAGRRIVVDAPVGLLDLGSS